MRSDRIFVFITLVLFCGCGLVSAQQFESRPHAYDPENHQNVSAQEYIASAREYPGSNSLNSGRASGVQTLVDIANLPVRDEAGRSSNRSDANPTRTPYPYPASAEQRVGQLQNQFNANPGWSSSSSNRPTAYQASNASYQPRYVTQQPQLQTRNYIQTAQNCCPPNQGYAGAAAQPPVLAQPPAQINVPTTGYGGAATTAGFQSPPAQYQPGIQPQYSGGNFRNWWTPLVTGTGAYQPVLRLQNMPPGVYLGQGIIGQPTAYVDGQPLRNLLRYITP